MSEVRKQLIIHLLADGNINVSGPLHEKLICFGMLEVAKQVIGNFKPSEAPRVELATPGVKLD